MVNSPSFTQGQICYSKRYDEKYKERGSCRREFVLIFLDRPRNRHYYLNDENEKCNCNASRPICDLLASRSNPLAQEHERITHRNVKVFIIICSFPSA
jgi:hypothetical protein